MGPVPVVVAEKDVTLDIDVLKAERSVDPFLGTVRGVGTTGMATLTGIPRGVTVTGQVVNAVPEAASLTLQAQNQPASRNIADIYLIEDSGEFAGRRVAGWRVAMDAPRNGRFEISNVPPGTYVVYASLPDVTGHGTTQPAGQAFNAMAFGRMSITVANSDIQNVTVRVHQGVDVKGRVTIDGVPAAPGSVEIALRSDDSAIGIAVYQQVARFKPAIASDGSFTIPAVPEGRYRVTVSLLADILQAGQSIRDIGIIVRDTAPAPIEVSVRTR
jgi:hypothetical protein